MSAVEAFMLRELMRSRTLASTGNVRRGLVAGGTSGRRHASTTAGPTLPASEQTSSARTAFHSATKFRLTPAQVNETNVPSAKEVSQMIPTLRELRAQLPEALELERRYVRPECIATQLSKSAETSDLAGDRGMNSADGTAPMSAIFQKTTDPLEDLLFGPPKEVGAAESQRPQRQHLLLAYRALLWGTVYALLGFGATVATAMYLCGYHSVDELLEAVRGKNSREEDRLRTSAGGDAGSASVQHYEIDLARPTEAWRQIQEVWSAVQRLAEEEDARAQSPATP
ncbi:hypothetical protein ABL78_5884 [Leptomonas seymouri]|uniref:Transmembrane protein 242 n=1 Tax=Leptomonas seymouri TaxID=5684 RepID=A0A0N0P498_LEPSE|nr:hypothetical protein ABL78_5884 [Leptomonas seymouri]|eukprot:KPI85046.1 hypothetical protein ABL78_5884 [Leptomonas seymouri]